MKLSQANRVGFIRLQGKTFQQMGFTCHSAKPSYSLGITDGTQSSQHSPLRTSQANRWVYQIVHSQAISLLGLSGYLTKLTFIVGFIRLSSQRLLTRSNTTRHNQANRWVYQATSQSIFPVGFIKLPRSWKGRIPS